MKANDFEIAKNKIVRAMLLGKAHCPESVAAVRKCTGLEDFVDVLNAFRMQFKNKQFPPISLLRELFMNELYELNKLGVYIDQEVELNNIENVWLFGHCKGSISSDRIKFFNIVVNDDAEVTINALPWTLQHIHIKSSRAKVKFNKAETAIQIINQI